MARGWSHKKQYEYETAQYKQTIYKVHILNIVNEALISLNVDLDAYQLFELINITQHAYTVYKNN